MEVKEKLFLSENILFDDSFLNGGVLVDCKGKIKRILLKSDMGGIQFFKNPKMQIFDFGSYVLMPGIIDTHVHVNEPGRTNWEGFETATKAAAAGGITTIVDMPLNSIPATTSLANLKTKLDAAKDQIFIDVGFWGGVVPGNENELLNMSKAGVVGFKCFLTSSGVDEFPYVQKEDVEKAIRILKNTDSILAFHAEFNEDILTINDDDPTKYETFLNTRPDKMEEEAIKFIVNLSNKYNAKLHIVHLSTATVLETLQKAKSENRNLTVETCPHYLMFNSENIPDKATEYKCCPPIRNYANKEQLWNIGFGKDIIDIVVSDHSPSIPDLKKDGNFLTSWGGISSLQFGLSIFWTELSKRGKKIFDINKYMTKNTSKLVGLHNQKGEIKSGFDADFVIWDPNDFITITKEEIFHKNKLTPYLGMKLKGKVYATVVRGEIVYKNGIFSDKKIGKLLVNEKIFQEN